MTPERVAILNAESRQTVRQAAGLGLQRALQMAMGVLFAAVIPRRMGPEVYGQFSTMVTMSLWFSLMGGLGAVSLMTRFVPEFLARGDREGLKKLASNLLTLRSANGLLGAIVYLILGATWLKDLDQAAIAFIALSIAVRTVANLPFTLFLGQNMAARWGASELMRRILTFPCVLIGYLSAGLRGAGAGLLAVELCVFALGLWWGREFLSVRLMKVDREFLRPYLRFSTAFFVSNVLLMLFNQGGTTLVRFVSGEYTEAGYYSLAFGAYLIGTQGVWRLLTAFGPLLSALHARNEIAELESWVGRLLKTLAIASVLAAALVYALGGILVRMILGPGFEPVTNLLPILALAGIAVAPSGVARLLAVSYKVPASSITGAALQIFTFLGLGMILIPRTGSAGACWVVVVSVWIFACYSTWHMRQFLPYSLKRWFQVVALGAALSPLVWAVPSNGVARALLFSAVFGVALITLGIAGKRDVQALGAIFGSSADGPANGDG